jgi:hypothetical protein
VDKVNRVSELWQHQRACAGVKVQQVSSVHEADNNPHILPMGLGQLTATHAAGRVSRVCKVKKAGGRRRSEERERSLPKPAESGARSGAGAERACAQSQPSFESCQSLQSRRVTAARARVHTESRIVDAARGAAERRSGRRRSRPLASPQAASAQVLLPSALRGTATEQPCFSVTCAMQIVVRRPRASMSASVHRNVFQCSTSLLAI